MVSFLYLGQCCSVNTNQSEVYTDHAADCIPCVHFAVVFLFGEVCSEDRQIVQVRVVKLVKFEAETECEEIDHES